VIYFLHARQDPTFAKLMLQSVRTYMADEGIVQLTDEETPSIDGCSVKRLPWTHLNPMIFKMEHLSKINPGLVLDTDVIVQSDLRHVFKLPFDMALTWRDGPIRDPDGNDITKTMPINCGVMFHRSQAFWYDCLRWCEGRDPGWYADQLAVAAIAPRFNVLRLHTDNFNYTPKTKDEDVSMRLAVHYKGKRKEWMLG